MRRQVLLLIASIAWASPATAQEPEQGPTASSSAPTGAPAAPAPSLEDSERAAPADAAAEESDDGPSPARAIFGWTAVAVGIGGAVAGVILASTAAAKYDDLDCPGDVCPPELADDAASYNDLRIPAGLLIASGAVVAFAGLPFLVIGTEELAEARLEVTPGGLTLRGQF